MSRLAERQPCRFGIYSLAPPTQIKMRHCVCVCVCVCVWRVSNNRNLSIPLTFFNAIFGKRGGPTGCLLRQKFPSLPRTTFSMCILLKVVSTVPSQSFFFVCVIVGSYFGWSREREREDHRITGSLLLSVHKRNTGRANEIAKNDGDCTKDLEGYILNSCLCGTTIGCETSLGNGQIESSKCQFLQRFLLSPIKSLRFLCSHLQPTRKWARKNVNNVVNNHNHNGQACGCCYFWLHCASPQ